MKQTFYKPVLVLFLVSKRNLFLPNKFLVRKQNKDGLQSCFATNNEEYCTRYFNASRMQKSLAVNLHFNFFSVAF